MRDGEKVSETRKIKLQADRTADVAFRFSGDEEKRKSPPVRRATTLTVHVPANAKVWLEGNPTSGSGEVRQFATTQSEIGRRVGEL